MYKATVIEIIFASPSDIKQEKKCFRDIIDEWNVINSRQRKTVLKSVDWEYNTYSSLEGQEPQAIINKQILENADLLVGIFWTRIGTPTKDFESGTIEEIKKHMQQKKPVMVFFSDAPVIPSSINKDQYDKLLIFKDWCEKSGIISNYDSMDAFIAKFRSQLGIIMNEDQYILNLIGNDNSEMYLDNSRVGDVYISDDAQELLKEVSLDYNGQLMSIMTLGGYTVQTNGKSIGTGSNDAREIANINAVIEELEKYDLIRATNQDRELFNITAKGYEVSDKLSK